MIVTFGWTEQFTRTFQGLGDDCTTTDSSVAFHLPWVSENTSKLSVESVARAMHL